MKPIEPLYTHQFLFLEITSFIDPLNSTVDVVGVIIFISTCVV